VGHPVYITTRVAVCKVLSNEILPKGQQWIEHVEQSTTVFRDQEADSLNEVGTQTGSKLILHVCYDDDKS